MFKSLQFPMNLTEHIPGGNTFGRVTSAKNNNLLAKAHKQMTAQINRKRKYWIKIRTVYKKAYNLEKKNV